MFFPRPRWLPLNPSRCSRDRRVGSIFIGGALFDPGDLHLRPPGRAPGLMSLPFDTLLVQVHPADAQGDPKIEEGRFPSVRTIAASGSSTETPFR